MSVGSHIFFHTKQHDFKTLGKTRAKANSLSMPAPHTNFLNLGNQARERQQGEKAQPPIASQRMYIEFISQTQGAQSEVPWAKFVPS